MGGLAAPAEPSRPLYRSTNELREVARFSPVFVAKARGTRIAKSGCTMFTRCLRPFVVAACLSACAASSPPPKTASTPAPPRSPPVETAPSTDPGAVECKLYCEAPRFVPRPEPEPDYTQREIDNASNVLSSMTDDLLGCYKTRLRTNRQAHGFITVDILVGPDGRVRKVDTTGGALLGDVTMACIVHRIERGVFEPPHGGGNIHVQMPFSLRVEGPDDQT